MLLELVLLVVLCLRGSGFQISCCFRGRGQWLTACGLFWCSQVAGSCWYLLGVQRVERCVLSECISNTTACKPSYVGCPLPIAMPGAQPIDKESLEWGQGNVTSLCLNNKSDYEWGIYNWAVPLVTTVNGLEKVVFQLLWGVMTVR